MDRNSKPLPGWEAFQPKEHNPNPLEAVLWDPQNWEPSGQALSDRQRLASKLTPEQQASYGPTPPQTLGMALQPRKRRK